MNQLLSSLYRAIVVGARLRNRVIHGYWSIDLGILHTTATDQLPDFIAQLRDALDTLTADD